MIKLGMFRTGVVLVASVAVACDVGSVLPQTGDDDGSGSGSGSGDSTCPDAATNAANAPTGHHAFNGAAGDPGATSVQAQIAAGGGCMSASGCHNGSNNATGAPATDDVWNYGGVAYQDQAGTMPYVGATILLTSTTTPPQYVKMTVAQNGFFWNEGDINPSFPTPAMGTFVQVAICDGTTTTPMSSELAVASTTDVSEMTTDGNCNGGTACHGASTDTGAFVYLTPSS